MSLRQGSSSFKPAERDFLKKRVSAWALHKSHASLDPSSNLSAPTNVLAGEKADDALQIRAKDTCSSFLSFYPRSVANLFHGGAIVRPCERLKA